MGSYIGQSGRETGSVSKSRTASLLSGPGRLIAVIAAIALLTAWAPMAHGQGNVQGTWQTLPTLMLINPVHTALLSNGKILVVSGSGNYPAQTTFMVGVWDPAHNTFTPGPNQNWDMFCNGMIVLPD